MKPHEKKDDFQALNRYSFLNLFFNAVDRKIICNANINGIKGIFQSILIQLIFAKNKIAENTIPIAIMIMLEVAFSLFELVNDRSLIKFILGAAEFVVLFVSMVMFLKQHKIRSNKNAILTENRKEAKKIENNFRAITLNQTQIFGDSYKMYVIVGFQVNFQPIDSFFETATTIGNYSQGFEF